MERVLEVCRLDFQRAYERGKWATAGMPTDEIVHVSELRSDQDQIRIWTVFAQRPRLSFCGDVLHLLMSVVPYPMPATHATPPPPWDAVDASQAGLNVHTGDITNFAVQLPESLRQYELNTDFSEVPEFVGAWPDAEFRRLLDQVSVASLNPSERSFPAPFTSCEKMPMAALGQLWQTFPPPMTHQILRDWGTIMRDALSRTVAPRKRRMLRAGYEKATLAWLTQRLGKERLFTGPP